MLKTKIIKENELNDSLWEKICKIIKQNNLIVFPTETVYGLGANALSDEAVEKIFLVKGRPQDNPLIIHISKWEMIKNLADYDIKQIKNLTDFFWPGPLTLILPRKKKCCERASCSLPTIALRMPAHPIALNLIEKTGLPIAAPSANISGRPSPTSAQMAWEDLNGKVEYILDGGSCEIGLESTVLDLSGNKPKILRPGFITFEELKEWFLDLELNFESEKPIAPGMKYRHYKPNYKIAVFENKELIPKIIQDFQAQTVFILSYYDEKYTYPHQIFENLTLMSKDLYYYFQKLEKQGIELLLIKKIPKKGIGFALMNRIEKAADKIYE